MDKSSFHTNHRLETHRFKFIDNYDGDTIKIGLYASPYPWFETISIRVAGVDSPEMRGKGAGEKVLARQAQDFVNNALKNTEIELTEIEMGRYSRLRAQVFYFDNGWVNLADRLIAKGLGLAYEGEARQKDETDRQRARACLRRGGPTKR